MRALQSRHRKLMLGSASLVVLVAIVLSAGIVRVLMAPLVVRTGLSHADALVVFGGGLSPDGRLGISTRERVKHAWILFSERMADYIIITGGYRVAPDFEETALMARELAALGVPEERIIVDRRARNTYENARKAYAICQKRGFSRVILVTSPYHMRRAYGCMRRFPITVLTSPVEESEVYERNLAARLRTLNLIVHEYGGLLSYWWRGWI